MKQPSSTGRRKNGQFNAGFSGNRRGRPRNPQKQSRSPYGVGDDFVIGEAKRMIDVGEEGEQLSVEEALFRAAEKAAARGGQIALKYVLERIRLAKKAREDQIVGLFGTLVSLKHDGQEKRRLSKERGLPPPVLHPDPDCIIIDERFCAAWVFGGLTPEVSAARQLLWQHVGELQQQRDDLQEVLKKEPKNRAAKKELAAVADYLRLYEGLDLDRPFYVGLLPEDQVPRPPSPALERALIEAAAKHKLAGARPVADTLREMADILKREDEGRPPSVAKRERAA